MNNEQQLIDLINETAQTIRKDGHSVVTFAVFDALKKLAQNAFVLGVAEGRRPRSIEECLEECRKWQLTDEELAELEC